MTEVQNILINLKVLQSLPCHARLDTTEQLFKIHTPASWVPIWAKRWWSAQTRVTDIGRIQTLYDKAIQYVNDNHNDSGRVAEYLTNSLRGLQNLQTTYTKDVTTVALLDVVLDNVNILFLSNSAIV